MDLPILQPVAIEATLGKTRLDAATAALARGQRGERSPDGLREVAGQFEALFYGQLIRAMRATVPENGFWGQEGGARIYRQLHDQALAERMADGGGLGIAELIVRQFQGTGTPAGEAGPTAPPAVGAVAPPDPRGLAAYRRQALADDRPAALARLRRRAEALGGAAADSLRRWQGALDRAAAAAGLDPALVLSVMVRESGGDPEAVSPRGAKGLMQLMPGTARELGVDDPADPQQNLLGGSRYLAAMLRRYDGDLDLALAAYNAGPGTVDRLGGRVPDYPETQRYIRAVKDLAGRLGYRTGTDLVRGRGEDDVAP